jgi:hypothetical protein
VQVAVAVVVMMVAVVEVAVVSRTPYAGVCTATDRTCACIEFFEQIQGLRLHCMRVSGPLRTLDRCYTGYAFGCGRSLSTCSALTAAVDMALTRRRAAACREP